VIDTNHKKADLNRQISVVKKLAEFRNQKADIPLIIGGKEYFTQTRRDIRIPHDKNHVLGQYCVAEPAHVKLAIDSALQV
jgi:1-pyrroline-5-carboxylate dehydrogenase